MSGAKGARGLGQRAYNDEGEGNLWSGSEGAGMSLQPSIKGTMVQEQRM